MMRETFTGPARRTRTCLLAAALCVLAGCGDDTGPGGDGAGSRTPRISFAEARADLAALLDDVPWQERTVTDRERVDLGVRADLAETLPRIDEYPIVVEPQQGGNDVVAEVFASTEKSGAGDDGWLVEVVNDFNRAGRTLASGRIARVRLRKIASGTGYQYIASGRYRPQGFTPSNHLWIRMAEARGVRMTPVGERLVGNVAGVVMRSEVADRLRSARGRVDLTGLVDAVVRGEVAMGYTDPFASSTGLNFLVSVLHHFAAGDDSRMLSPEVVSGFEEFQRGVPFVALTTLQMRDSVVGGGSLDAFVMEYQTYVKTPLPRAGYEFVPFGVRHDNPLYAVGEPAPEQLEVLRLLAEHARGFADLARRYGFDAQLGHDSAFSPPEGNLLVRAQALWKEKKNAGRPVAAVFLSDVSGSMRGTRIRGVREALRKGAEFVSAQSSVGLVLFNDQVTVRLPIGPFDLNQRAAFLAAVRSIDTGGGTAMYDGIVVALSLLAQEKEKNPDVKPLLIVLTDGQTRDGLEYAAVQEVISGLRIPVYTIGYEARLEELQRLSSLVEAATIDADEGNIAYKIGSLLNAQL